MVAAGLAARHRHLVVRSELHHLQPLQTFPTIRVAVARAAADSSGRLVCPVTEVPELRAAVVVGAALFVRQVVLARRRMVALVALVATVG
jgi:hypothetical protein